MLSQINFEIEFGLVFGSSWIRIRIKGCPWETRFGSDGRVLGRGWYWFVCVRLCVCVCVCVCVLNKAF